MIKFCFKILLILMPLILICSYIFLPIIASREYMNIDKIAEDFASGKIQLYGEMLSSPTASNYLRGEQLRQSKNVSVIAFGTSRTMPISKKIFTNRDDFLNLAFSKNGTNDLDEYKIAVDNILQYTHPDVLIFGLDQNNFNSNYMKEWNITLKEDNEYFDVFEYKESDRLSYLKTYFNNLMKFRLSPLTLIKNFGIKRIGLDAVLNGIGITPDGPCYFGNLFDSYYGNGTYFRNRFNRTEKLLDEFTDVFTENHNPDANSIKITEGLLEYCAEKNIYVIAFIPPYANLVNDVIKSPNSKLSYVPKIYEELNPIFEKYNFELYDYTDVSTLGITDECFIDGSHISEVSFGEIIVDMLEKGSRLNEYINKNDLQNKIDNAYSIFEYEKWRY